MVNVLGCDDEDALHALVGGYPEAYLLVGFGERAQYADVDGAVRALQPHLEAAQARCGNRPFLLVYGGDTSRVATIGTVAKRLRALYACEVLAVQAAGQHEDWVDHAFICEPQHERVVRLKDGVEVEVQERLYGGTRGGVPVGGSRVYMGHHFFGRPADNVPGLIRTTFFLGGGGIALEELQYCDAHGAPWVYIPCQAGDLDVYKSTFGPVHDWVVHKLAAGVGQLALCGNGAARAH